MTPTLAPPATTELVSVDPDGTEIRRCVTCLALELHRARTEHRSPDNRRAEYAGARPCPRCAARRMVEESQ
jgi:hypothetical protein